VVIEKREMSIFILLIINNRSRAESWTGKKQGALPARDELSGSLAWSVQKTYPGTFVPCTRTEPAGADARMIIKQAASGIPVFLLLFSLNRIQDRGPFTRSRSHALKSPGHSAATAVGPNYRPIIIRKISSLGLPWCGIAWRNRDMPWHSLPFRPAYRSFPHMRRKPPHIFYRLEHDGWNCSA
jgi:hypothetical protein